MTATDYEKILAALARVSRVLDANQGRLTATDIRIRCLASITTKETKRAIWEAGQSRPSPHGGSLEAADVSIAHVPAASA